MPRPRVITYRLAGAALAGLAAVLLAAVQAPGQVQRPVEQEPTYEGPIVRLRFLGDYLELEAWLEEHDLQLLRFDQPFLYLAGTAKDMKPLRDQGLQPEMVDRMDFLDRLVRVEPADPRSLELVRSAGGELVQLEEGYAIFRVSLRELERLEALDLKVGPFREGDLEPRFVSIEAPDEASIELILSVGVDVFEVTGGKAFGRASDGQIEKLREHGLGVERTTP